jgi:diguanylate cyclase (GGDEF)-like protein
MLDQGVVARLAGVLFCFGGVIAGLLLALDPPTAALGDVGWIPAGTTIAVAFALGIGLVRAVPALGPRALMAIALAGPVMIGTLQWLAGSASSYHQVLILSVVWCGVVLPARRLAILMLADAVVAFLPAAYGDWSASLLPDRIATLGVAWALALLCLAWSSRLRGLGRTLHAERSAADDLARIDALTGLGNRRALDEAIVTQIALARRTGRPVSALVGDLDGFKAINDRHGHHMGDALLRDVAAVLREVIRGPDACFRWGGDEFVVLLGDADAAEAREVAARIATAIDERCATPDGMPVSMSLGAAAHAEGVTGAELLADADTAMLLVKSGARTA